MFKITIVYGEKKMTDCLYFVIPAYNEQENVEELINDWYPVVDGVSDGHLFVINDGSKDNTYDILKKLSEKRPKLCVLTKENGGHGDTLLYGYQYAVDHGADWIFQTDSDGQTKATEFAEFWAERDAYDAILGCRPKRGDGLSRKFVEKVLCALIALIFSIKIPDANCPFRLMRAEKVVKYMKRLPEHYFLPNVMLTVFFAKNERTKFKEVTFESRKGGKNSINTKKIMKIGLQSVKDFRQFKKEML